MNLKQLLNSVEVDVATALLKGVCRGISGPLRLIFVFLEYFNY